MVPELRPPNAVPDDPRPPERSEAVIDPRTVEDRLLAAAEHVRAADEYRRTANLLLGGRVYEAVLSHGWKVRDIAKLLDMKPSKVKKLIRG